ncbi:hypothetical protein [Alysiella filiformis]|uniref:hypothetical protein n=1 Tax=Alysiella filiformis TaxID=194196 RepID=UPI001C536310|nr:hypothetical protein [Alysiella filiformis]
MPPTCSLSCGRGLGRGENWRCSTIFPSPQPSPTGEGVGCGISTMVGNVLFFQ